jgi:hypothetical protein
MIRVIEVTTFFTIFEGNLEEVSSFILQWGLTVVGAGDNDNSVFVA